MTNKLIGEYGLAGSSVAVVIFSLSCYINYLFFKGSYDAGATSQRDCFTIVFIDLTGLIIISLPLLAKKAANISNDTIKIFLDLPSRDVKFTFSAITGFLSDQALASFLATVLIFTGKQAFANYGGVIAAFYTMTLFSISILVGCVSLIRFITHFSKFHGAFYAIAATLSTMVMFAFFNVGLKMAA